MYNSIRSFFLSIIAPAVVLTATGCHSENKAEPPATVVPPALFSVTRGQLSSTLRMPGELMAWQQVDLYAKVNSFVKKLNVDVGSEVVAGQVLATMEAPEINSQLSGAESRLKSLEAVYIGSKANYNRLLETSKTPGTISPNELDLALARSQSDLAQFQAARAAYSEVGNNRDYLVIRAPFSGVITARNVSAGAYVGPSGKGSDLPLFTLQEHKKLRLVVSIPETYTAYLANKNQVNFSVKSLPGDSFTASIQRMAGALDYKLRSQRIEMDVPNPDHRLLPGMVAEISLDLPSRDSVFVVPETAVINAAEGIFVIRSVHGKAEWVPVSKGRSEMQKMEVYGGLTQGDSLVAHATEEIRNGSTIR